MSSTYLIALIQRNCNINAVISNAQNHVAFDNVGLQPFSMGIVGPSMVYANTQSTVGADRSRWMAFSDTATPPGIAQGCRLLHPGTTTRVPDYDKMRNMCPDEWLNELRKPSLVLAVPEKLAMPLPTRSKKVNRKEISAIVDQDWEYREGGVQLVNTEEITTVEGHSVEDGLKRHQEGVPPNTAQTAISPIRSTSSIKSSLAAVTPVVATTQISIGPMCHCNWADCPYCPIPIPNEVREGAGTSNWQAAFTIRSTGQGSLHKATSPRVRTQGRRKNSRTTQAKPAKKATGGACKGTPQRAVTQQPMKGVRADAEEEYWQVATLLGLVRRV